MYTYIYIYIHIHIMLLYYIYNDTAGGQRGSGIQHLAFDADYWGQSALPTPSSHHKIFPQKICSKGWVAQKPFCDR